ncbi:hypothetical protein [Maricaulis sp.]|uniref:hypothetical protein n=1 Tax=Maricaulis sp. TaxID=1486257 RepID=UPI003A910F4F
MNIAFNTAVTGLLSAQAQTGAASESLVTAAVRGEGIIQAVVAVKRAETAQHATANLVKVADDMTRTMLDIIA